MAKRKPKDTPEEQMQSDEINGAGAEEVEQEQPQQEQPQQDTGEDPPPQQVEATQTASELEAQEASLKQQLAELRKLKKDQKKATKTNGSKPEKVAKEKTVRPPKDEANGVTRPGMGVTKEVWDTADKLSERLGTYVDRATLSEVLAGKIEVGTIHTQYGRWRKYYGLTETREQRAERMATIRAKKLADLGMTPQPESQPGEATQ